MSSCALLVGVSRRLDLAAEDHVDGALGAHDGDLRGRPRERGVGPEVLGVHDDVRAAVGLARDHGHLRHGGLAERVQELRAVPDDPAVLLRGAGQEAGDVLERHDRDVERVAEPDEAGRLLARRRCRACRRAPSAGCRRCRPCGRPAARSRSRCSSPTAGRPLELAVVDDVRITSCMSYGAFAESGMMCVEASSRRPGRRRWRTRAGPRGCSTAGSVSRYRTCSRHVLVVLGDEARDAGLAGVRHGAAELLERDVLARHRLDHVGAGDEHVRGVLHHER